MCWLFHLKKKMHTWGCCAKGSERSERGGCRVVAAGCAQRLCPALTPGKPHLPAEVRPLLQTGAGPFPPAPALPPQVAGPAEPGAGTARHDTCQTASRKVEPSGQLRVPRILAPTGFLTSAISSGLMGEVMIFKGCPDHPNNNIPQRAANSVLVKA